jgi:hypothetical protein
MSVIYTPKAATDFAVAAWMAIAIARVADEPI